jgi:hemerythrin
MAEQKFVEWDDRFSVGIPLVDSQHKQLIVMTNALYLACSYNTAAAKAQFQNTVHQAVAYVKYHFSTEEQIMEKTAYPGMADHKKQHADFVQTVFDNVKAFEEGKNFVPNQFVRFLKDWVLSHIAITDSKLGDFLIKLQKEGKLGKITMKKKTPDEPCTEKPIVLAVDDMKTQLAFFKQTLTRYDVFTCASPLQALEMISYMDVDLVLLDLAMEEMSGYEFLKRLKKDPRLKGIPVIVVSGNRSEEHIAASLKLGARDFIAKPAAPELVEAKIQAILAGSSPPVSPAAQR